MKIQLQISTPVRTSEFVTDVTFSDKVMVSLDCVECSRCHRSVVLDKSGYFSYCTPSKHKFDGRILKLHSTRTEAPAITTGHYLIEYEWDSFKDAKYPERVPTPDSTWARVKIFMRCKCGANVMHETQNNRVRPLDIECECGLILATEVKEVPEIRRISGGSE